MERLTKRRDDGHAFIPCHWKESAEAVDKGQERLAEIEDILGATYDLGRLQKLVEADKKKGQPVWVVERNKIEEPCEVGGYVFIALVDGVALVHPYIGGCGDIDDILYDCLEKTAEDMHCDLSAFPIEDCYLSKEAAELALKGER